MTNPFNWALCHAMGVIPHFYDRDGRDKGVQQLITQECLHMQALPMANPFCKLFPVKSSHAVALETSDGWLGTVKFLQTLQEVTPHCPINYVLWFPLPVYAPFEFELIIPEASLSKVLCSSWFLSLEDASVDPQTVEAIYMVPETSAVWKRWKILLVQAGSWKKTTETMWPSQFRLQFRRVALVIVLRHLIGF